MGIEDWKRRYTVREFDKNFSLKNEEIEDLLSIAQYIPTQESRENTLWLALGPEDQIFKTWLFENLHYIEQENGSAEHMYAVASAPLVLTNCVLENDDDYEAFKMQGIQAGAFMSEALHMGFDVSSIGCVNNSFHNSLEKQRNFKKMAFEYFGVNAFAEYGVNTLDDYMKPSLSICIGKGLPYKDAGQFKDNYDTRGGKRVFLGQKRKKRNSGIIRRK